MSAKIVVPDTGILLAAGFGPSLDPQAPLALDALAMATAAKVPVLVPPSIAEELNERLQSLDSIYQILQETVHVLTGSRQLLSGLAQAEQVLLTVKRKVKSPTARYYRAVELEVAKLVNANPNASLNSIFTEACVHAMLTKEVVKAGTHPSNVEFLTAPTPDRTPGGASVSDVSNADLVHLRSCQALGSARNCAVIFVVLERQLHTLQKEVAAVFPRVLVTNAHFLRAHLSA